MKTIAAHCFHPGLLELGGRDQTDANDTDHSGAHAAYRLKSQESLLMVAKRYDYVQRPNGKKVKGRDYTTRMAKNDFQ